MSNSLRKLSIILGVVVVAGGLYLFYLNQPDESEVIQGLTSGEVAVRTEKILSDIRKVEGYELATDIFTDIRFTSLKDYAVEIPEIETGRTNPFESI